MNDPFLDSELAEVFDRYSEALDSGDQVAAEKILDNYPAISEKFREPLRGLYLLGRAAQQEKHREVQSRQQDPTRLGDFEIEEEIGRGGMGIVYSAWQMSLQRRVALKTLPFTAVLDPRQVARFQNEARAAASLHHPNIVPVYGVGCERGMHYYSMQLIEGQTLSQFIQGFRDKRPDQRTASPGLDTVNDVSTLNSIESKNYVRHIVETCIKVALAIGYAHEQGIVHRDIKPSNLLLDQRGKIWVADFGLARGRGESNLTSQGDQVGTLRYMSPEQAAGRNNQVDFRSDIYSFGVTMYELLTLRPAFSAENRLLLLADIENREPTSIRALNPSVSFDLETVICKAISKNPAERYNSSTELANDLARTLEGQRVQAKRKTLFDRALQKSIKHKGWVATIASGLVLTAIISIMIASVFYNQKKREHAAAENARFYLQQAHQSVDRFGSLLTDELISLPGTAPLRAKILSEAIGYYDDFLAYADGSVGLEFEKAKAHAQLAALRERSGQGELAIEHYQISIDQFESLTGNPEAKLEIGINLDRIGLLHKRRGNLSKSSFAFKQALGAFNDLSGLGYQPSTVTCLASQTQANLGSLNWCRGLPDDAIADFEQAIAKLEPFSNDNIENLEIQSVFHKINGNYVQVLKQVDPERSLIVLRDSLSSLKDINLRLAENDSENLQGLVTENGDHIADMQNNLANVLAKRNQLDLAEELANAAVTHWKARLKEQAFELVSAERLATARNTLGEILWRKKSDGLGESAFDSAEKLLMKIAELLPHRPETLSRLAGVLHNRSLIANAQARSSEAIQRIELAIQFQSKALELAPHSLRYKNLKQSHLKVYNALQPDSATGVLKDAQTTLELPSSQPLVFESSSNEEF